MKSKYYSRGMKEIHKMFGEKGEKLIATLEKISPQYAEMVVEYPFGHLYARERQLDLRIREFITIAVLTVQGHNQPQLELHVRSALKLGIKKEEIIEAIMQMTAYGGVATTVNAVLTADKVFSEFKMKEETRGMKRSLTTRRTALKRKASTTKKPLAAKKRTSAKRSTIRKAVNFR